MIFFFLKRAVLIGAPVHPQEPKKELRPRLCTIKKGTNGYGFNLHSEKSKPGQYVRAVDEDSPAMKAGLRPQDRIVQVQASCRKCSAPLSSSHPLVILTITVAVGVQYSPF